MWSTSKKEINSTAAAAATAVDAAKLGEGLAPPQGRILFRTLQKKSSIFEQSFRPKAWLELNFFNLKNKFLITNLDTSELDELDYFFLRSKNCCFFSSLRASFSIFFSIFFRYLTKWFLLLAQMVKICGLKLSNKRESLICVKEHKQRKRRGSRWSSGLEHKNSLPTWTGRSVVWILLSSENISCFTAMFYHHLQIAVYRGLSQYRISYGLSRCVWIGSGVSNMGKCKDLKGVQKRCPS